MKYLKQIPILSFLIISLSCSTSSPEESAKAFLENVFSGNFEEAKKYGTSGTAKLLNLIEADDKITEEMFKEEIEIKVIDTEIDGKTAICKVELIPSHGISQTIPIRLEKDEGRWLVKFSKEDILKEAMKKEKGVNKEDIKKNLSN